jgi:hypothetical protein
MSALAETLRALAAVLDGQRLGWFVFGEQAVAARGAPARRAGPLSAGQDHRRPP